MRPAPVGLAEGSGVAHEVGTGRFEEAYERGVEALLRRDLVAAHAAFTEADDLRPGDRKVVANLTRLRELGVGQ